MRLLTALKTEIHRRTLTQPVPDERLRRSHEIERRIFSFGGYFLKAMRNNSVETGHITSRMLTATYDLR